MKGQMAFYGTETDQGLGLGRMQSLLDLPCVLEAANIHYTGPELRRWCKPLICLERRQDVVVDRHLLQFACLVLDSLHKFKHPHFSYVQKWLGTSTGSSFLQ